MRKLILLLSLGLLTALLPARHARAQDPVTEVIKAGVKKAIKAVDLQIQRQQNKVIWLQNAQKQLENAMTELRLGEIRDWVERQHVLYQDYYQELHQVKTLVADYQRIKRIAEKQARLLDAYEHAWRLLRQDPHFSAGELAYMARVYTGMLEESSRNLDLLLTVVEAYTTQMGDARRLELIGLAAARVEATYHDLVEFNRQNVLLSLQRAREQQGLEGLRELYGLPR
jgi:hypothetical protein